MRRSVPSLLPLFRSETQIELLALLLLQPDRSWTLEELAGRLAAPQSSVHRELGRAVSAGLVARDDRRRPHHYAAATDAPTYAPMRELLDVTVGVPVRLGAALEEVPGVLAAAIHGSWAGGHLRPDSDLDVLIVTEHDGERRAARRAAAQVGGHIGREVDATVVSRQNFDEMLRSGNPFVQGLLGGPRIDVVGDIEVLADTR